MPDQKSITILHLSDLQFGRNHCRFGNLAPNEPRAQFEEAFERFNSDLRALAQDGIKPEIVIVSGDLTFTAHKSQFEDSLRFLQELSRSLELSPGRTVIVPGHHDVNQNHCKTYFQDCEEDGGQPQEPYSKKWTNYIWLLNQFYKGEQGISFTVDQPWSFRAFEDLGVVAAGFNSTMKESHLPDSHYGWLGERQLLWFAERLGACGNRGWLRLGVMHHSIEAGGADDETLRDAEDLQLSLKPAMDFLFQGHMQTRSFFQDASAIPVLATGMARPPSGAERHAFCFQCVRFSEGQLETWVRSYDEVQRRWRAGESSHGNANSGRTVHRTSVSYSPVSATGVAPRSSQIRPLQAERFEIPGGRERPGLNVFLCHASEDKPEVRKLFRRLSEDGYQPWLDEERILPGKKWEPEIEEALRGSHAIVICLSATSARKEGYIQKEVLQAIRIAEEKPDEVVFIIPALLETCRIPSRLRDWQYVDLALAGGYEKLCLALDARCSQLSIEPRRQRPSGRDREQDFLKQVADVCSLRHPSAQVEMVRPQGNGQDYLRIRFANANISDFKPVGVSERGISEEVIDAFYRDVVEQSRSLDSTVQCEIVYGGDLASAPLVARANRRGIRLVSFAEFQGIIDFREYTSKQTARLQSDIIYPPGLYVPQRVVYEIGRERRDSRDACADTMDWLRQPAGRFALVLGDFGTGKTFLLHEIARRIPEEIPHLVPVLIELRNLEKARTFEQLIAQHLAGSGEIRIDLAAFPYMLREGRIALLFDGFDELVLRVSYNRATEHLDTLLQAAQGRAKVVVSSRTQHFESDDQVKTALYQKAEIVPSLRVARLQPFDDQQIFNFLKNLLEGDQEKAEKRFALIHDIRDLLGLSHNPRMLSFIAALPEQQLREAQARTGKITSAELYRLLIGRWLSFEEKRVSPAGAVPTLDVQERWDAVTAVALCLWPKLDRTMRLTELTEEMSRVVEKLTQAKKAGIDPHTATHLVGSGTLLVRDESGAFAFVHQSVMEWLVANRAAQQLKTESLPSVLALREMSALMADFFCDLAGREAALGWARATLGNATLLEPAAKANALLVLTRLGHEADEIPVAVNLAGADLRGKSFSRQNLAGANLVGADLTDARLDHADLSYADLTNAVLENANLTKARLVGARLNGARASGATLIGADLRGAALAGAKLSRARLAGAKVSEGALEGCDLFGAALPHPRGTLPMVSWVSPVDAGAFGPQNLFASGHFDSMIRLWDLAIGQQIRGLTGHSAGVNGVAFSTDGQRLASASDDKTLKVWDVQSGQELRTLKGHEGRVMSVAFSTDGQRLASASADKTVKVWDAQSGQELRTLKGHENSVMSVAFSADGQRVASGSYDKTVKVWDARSGQELRTLKGHDKYVMSVAFSGDGQRLASANNDWTVKVWDAQSGQELRTLKGHGNYVMSVAFSGDGQRLASASWDQTVKVWDAQSGQELRTLKGHENRVNSVVFSGDGQRLASASSDQTVKVWDAQSGQELRTLKGHESWLNSVAFSGNGYRLASAGWDQTVKIWDAQSGQELRTLKGHESHVMSVAFSGDGQRLASGSYDQTVKVWDAQSGQELRTLKGHKKYVNSVVFSGDGRRLASASADNTVKVWDAQSGQELRTLKGHESWVNSVVFSGDGKRLASGSTDKTVKVWDAQSGQELRTLKGHKESVTSVAISGNGQRLASASSERTVKVWNVQSGQELRTLKGHESWVNSVTFSGDGQRLASGSSDKTVKVWHVSSGQELATLKGHESYVMSVAFSPDGRRLASAGADNTLRLWEVESGRLLATIVPAAEGWAVFTPDGRYKVSGNVSGFFWYAVNLCRFEPGELDEFLPPGTLRRVELDEPLY